MKLIFKTLMLGAAALFFMSVMAAGGCKSSSTPSVGPSPSPTPIASVSPGASPSPSPTANVFVALDYPSVPPTTDPVYGPVEGYASIPVNPIPSSSASPSPMPTISSAIVTVACHQNIQFFNLDGTGFHTASSLGPANGMNWPKNFNNQLGTVASPQLTAISYQDFSTGNLSPHNATGWFSLVYTTGATAGPIYFGDYYEYNPIFGGYPSMRTVINVVGPC